MKASTVLSLSLLMAPDLMADEPSVLAKIDALAPGALEVRAFHIREAQEVTIAAKDLEAMKHTGELTTAWILESSSRRVVFQLSESAPSKTYRGFRDYDETLRLGPGVYEVYYATLPDQLETYVGEETWWLSAGRAIKRLAESTLLGREAFAEATEELYFTVRGRGRPLTSGELEDLRRRVREEAVVSLSPLGDDEEEVRAFELREPLELEIYAFGEILGGERYDYGWIIDIKSRRKVWSFEPGDTEPGGGNRKNRLLRHTLRLPAGRYAAFYVTDDSHSADGWNALPPRDPELWGLTLWARSPGARELVRHFEYREIPEERVLLELTRLGDGRSVSRGFTLEEPTEVRVYAVGEGTSHGLADYGWIVDARTRRPVWRMDMARTVHAGGAKKNRLADEVVRLDAGSYLVLFVTDGSHSYRDWNSRPPARPERWGITLLAASESFDPQSVKPYRPEEDRAVVARIDRVGNGRHITRKFALEAPARLAVYALGEGMADEMYDFGWLEDAETGEVVWEMRFEATEKAGGARKNRVFRGNLELSAGRYLVHYKSDGSHSYAGWNEAAPHDPEAWGIQLSRLELEKSR